MKTSNYERLSAQDSSFLMFEHRSTPMHVAAVSIFETGPLATETGGIDVERIAKHIASRLDLLPRYRQKLVHTPLQRHPVWVDDDSFDLGYHLRHTCVPRPGSEADLKKLVGLLISQHLDRNRPLWEMWVVEGLEGGRFAMICKVHHCMVDGASGVNILTLLMSPSPDEPLRASPPWDPRPVPSAVRLVADEVLGRALVPVKFLRGLRRAVRDPGETSRQVADGLGAAWEAIREGLQPPAATPLNRPIGFHRRMEWVTLDLAEVKAVRRRLHGTVNDVVLATVTGALRRFLASRHFDLEGLDFRVMMPVNMRRGPDDLAAANQVSGLFLSLPVSEPDPARRFALTRSATQRAKDSRAAGGIELFTRAVDWARSTLITRLGVGLASVVRPYNLIVTNVRGPQHPLYLLGSKLEAIYPQVPLFSDQALGVAVVSYDGKVCWGLVGDWKHVPDLEAFGHAIEVSFRELASLRAPPNRPSRPETAGRASAST